MHRRPFTAAPPVPPRLLPLANGVDKVSDLLPETPPPRPASAAPVSHHKFNAAVPAAQPVAASPPQPTSSSVRDVLPETPPPRPASAAPVSQHRPDAVDPAAQPDAAPPQPTHSSSSLHAADGTHSTRRPAVLPSFRLRGSAVCVPGEVYAAWPAKLVKRVTDDAAGPLMGFRCVTVHAGGITTAAVLVRFVLQAHSQLARGHRRRERTLISRRFVTHYMG